MFKFALANFLRYKTRFIFVSLTVIFGVTLATATLLVSSSLTKTLNDFSDTTTLSSRNLNISSQPPLTNISPHDFEPQSDQNNFQTDDDSELALQDTHVDNALIKQIKNQDFAWVDDVVGWIEVSSGNEVAHPKHTYAGLDIQLKTTNNKVVLDTDERATQSLSEAGFGLPILSNYQTNANHNPFLITSGRLPQQANEISIDERFAQKQDLNIGDSLTVVLSFHDGQTQSRQFEIVGLTISKFIRFLDVFQITSFFEGLEDIYPYFVFVDSDLRYLLDLEASQYSFISVYAKNTLPYNHPDSYSQQQQRFSDIDSFITNDPNLDQHYWVNQNMSVFDLSQITDDMATFVKVISWNLLIFISLAMLVGISVIINTFNIIIVQRTRELALFRALAFSKSHIFSVVIWEAVMIGVVACLIGMTLGLLATIGLWGIANFAKADLSLSINLTSFIFPCILGLGITLLASLSPALKASRLSIIEGLGLVQTFQQKSLLARKIAGGCLLGVFGLLVGALVASATTISWEDSNINNFAIMMAGILVSYLFIIVGIATLMPLFIKWFSHAFEISLSPVIKKIKLATANLRRDTRRLAATTNVLVLGSFLIVLPTIVIGSFEKTAIDSLNEVYSSDWGIESANSAFRQDDAVLESADADMRQASNPDLILADLKAYAGVEDVNLVGYDRLLSDFEKYNVAIIDPKTINAVSLLGLSPQDQDALNSGRVLVYDQGFENQTQIVLANKPHNIKGEFDNQFLFGNEVDIIMSAQTYMSLNSGLGIAGVSHYGLYMNTADGYDSEEVNDKLEFIIKKHGADNYRLVGVSVIINQIKTVFGVILNILRSLFGLSVIVAFIGVFNTVSLSILERIREIGILRAIGMTKRQLKNMINLESMMVGFIGVTVGFILGLILSGILFVMIKALLSGLSSSGQSDGGVNLSFTIPIFDILLYYLIVLVLMWIATLWSTRKVSKLDIVTATSKYD